MSPTALAAASPLSDATAARFDIYAAIHKALRLFMVDTLQRTSAIDLDDAGAAALTLDQLDALCAQMRGHLAHENEFLHPVLEAAQPGSSQRIAGEHEHHLDAIASLEDATQALRAAGVAGAQRAALAQRLYRQLALFVAENFVHMNHEETAHNAVLWSAYSDAQLAALDGRIVASLPPQELTSTLRWMARALTPQELRALLTAARAGMPAGAFAGVLALVRGELHGAARAHALQGLAAD